MANCKTQSLYDPQKGGRELREGMMESTNGRISGKDKQVRWPGSGGAQRWQRTEIKGQNKLRECECRKDRLRSKGTHRPWKMSPSYSPGASTHQRVSMSRCGPRTKWFGRLYFKMWRQHPWKAEISSFHLFLCSLNINLQQGWTALLPNMDYDRSNINLSSEIVWNLNSLVHCFCEIRQVGFSMTAPLLWNSLPRDARLALSLLAFCHSTKTEMLDRHLIIQTPTQHQSSIYGLPLF